MMAACVCWNEQTKENEKKKNFRDETQAKDLYCSDTMIKVNILE